MNSYRYSEAEIAAIERVIRERRDIRHFAPGLLPEGCLERLVRAAHLAPSVGYMQPWRMVHVKDAALREKLHAIVETERQATAAALPARQAEFLRLKIEGIRDCAEILVVALMDGRAPHIFGRRTLPEMDLASAACAIQNLWLTARAMGIGVGWVSFFDPVAVAELFTMPAGAQPIAILCIGHAVEFPSAPLLETAGWGSRLPLADILFEDSWPAEARPTPTAY